MTVASHRGRLWLTTFMAALTLGSFVFAAWSFHSLSQSLTTSRAQAERTEAATAELCGLGSTLKDVVVGGIAVVYAELQDPNVPESTHKADRAFLRRFRADLDTVNFLIGNPHSACQRASTKGTP